MAGKAAEADFFISRAGADKAFAIWLAYLIRAQGKTTLLQDEDFGHESFMAQMDDALKGGARVIAILTPDYLAREYCIKEANGALKGDPNNRKRRLAPFRLRPCAPSGMLNDIPYCDLLPELRARDVNALAAKILGDLRITTRNFSGVPKLPDGLTIDPPPLVQPSHPSLSTVHGPRRSPRKAQRAAAGRTSETRRAPQCGRPLARARIRWPRRKRSSGLGGVGKTELAREFGWRNQSAYCGRVVDRTPRRATASSTASSSLASASIRASARRRTASRPRAPPWKNSKIAACKSPGCSSTTTRENPAAIDGWMPRAGAHCLITSRWRDWTGEADALDVDVFPPDVAVDYLCDASGRSQPQDREDAALLARELGYLPLALSHAAAFCRSRDTDFKDYLEKLAERVKEKPDRRSRQGKDYPWSVYETFELGLERVLAGQPELGVPPQPRAEELMGIMAYLGSEGIPLELFPESLFSREELSGLVAALNEAALLTRTRLPGGASAAVNVHRLVQRVMQLRLAAKASAAASAAVTLVADAFPCGDGDQAPDDVRSWPRCRFLEPHAVAALAHAPDEGDAAEKTGLLLNQYALHLSAGGLRRGGAAYRRAIRIGEVSQGPEHPTVAIRLGNLAGLLIHTSQIAEAKSLRKRELAIMEEALPPEHPYMATALNNLATLLQRLGRFSEAEPLMRRALALGEKSLGTMAEIANSSLS